MPVIKGVFGEIFLPAFLSSIQTMIPARSTEVLQLRTIPARSPEIRLDRVKAFPKKTILCRIQNFFQAMVQLRTIPARSPEIRLDRVKAFPKKTILCRIQNFFQAMVQLRTIPARSTKVRLDRVKALPKTRRGPVSRTF